MDHREFEETLTRLDSVDAVRVVSESDRVVEVHILASPDKTPKQVVRDVQSLAMARFGLNIDRRVISVVQIAPDSLGGTEAERPALINLQDRPEGSRTTIAVTLKWQKQQYVGQATGPSVASTRLRLVGEATLAALDEMMTDGPPLALDAVGSATVGMRKIIIAVVVSATGMEEAVSVGSAIGDGDEAEATVRAVLDALNRRLPKFSK